MLRGTERVYERPRPYRIEHISLSLQLDHATASLVGEAELTIARVSRDARELRLDAVAFELTSVHYQPRKSGAGKSKGRGKTSRRSSAGSWRRADFVYDGESLQIALPVELDHGRVRVRYRARPQRGMYFIAPDEVVADRPEQIWTQCQDEDARHIFPCHDKPHVKQTMDVQVQVEPGWFVLSNGVLDSSAAAQRRGQYHYRMGQPLPSYLFTVVAGRFAAIEDRHGELPVVYYVPPGREEDGRRSFAHTPQMIALFERLTGVAYPWSRYAQIVVSDFIFGGMENTGATTLYEHILLDERAALDVSSDDLIAHELAHQWFGDLVTCRDWSHAWLNEGFATFMEHVWRDHHLGRDEYLQGLEADLDAYLGEAHGRYQRPVVCQDYRVPIDIFDRHLYEKGALFLHTLRSELGDDMFWSGVHRYLEQGRGGVVETRDLLRCLEEVSGKSLEQRFEQALHRAGHPLVSVEVSWEEGLLLIAVEQTLAGDQSPFVFDLEIDVGVATRGRAARRGRRERWLVTEARHTFSLPLAQRPSWVAADPELRILGKLQHKAPADMLRAQLADASTARGRRQAAEALGRRHDPTTVVALAKALRSSRAFWGVRSAAAVALGKIRSEEAFGHLRAGLRTRHPKVRRAVAQALGSFRTSAAAKLLARVARDDDSVLVVSSAARALGATRQEEAYDVLVSLIDEPSWADVVSAGVIAGLGRLRDERAVEVLREQTRYGVPERRRRSAAATLPTLSTNRKTRELLEDLLDDRDPHLRVAAVVALGEVGDVKARPALRRQLQRDLDGRVRRRIAEVLRDLGSRGRRAVDALREELDELRRQHGELSVRLSKLEERTKAPNRKRR